MVVRYEVDLYRVWLGGLDAPAYVGYAPKSGNSYIYTVKNQPTNIRTVSGQRRTYTDGVLTATVDFTLDPGASVVLPALATLISTDMTAMLAPEAGGVSAHYWCPAQWLHGEGEAHSLTYRFTATGTA